MTCEASNSRRRVDWCDGCGRPVCRWRANVGSVMGLCALCDDAFVAQCANGVSDWPRVDESVAIALRAVGRVHRS